MADRRHTVSLFNKKFNYTFTSIVGITVSTSAFTSINNTRVTVMDSITDITFPIEPPSYTYLVSSPYPYQLVMRDWYLHIQMDHRFPPSTSSYSPSNSAIFSSKRVTLCAGVSLTRSETGPIPVPPSRCTQLECDWAKRPIHRGTFH